MKIERRTLVFLAGQCITLFGSSLVQMAIVWHITLRTGSGAWVAAFSLCGYLPQFLLSFPGGVWADRYARKRLIIAADAGVAAVTLLMALWLPHIHGESAMLLALLGLCALRSAGAGVQAPAVGAVIAQLAPPDGRMRLNGLYAAMQSLVQFAAPAAAGVLMGLAPLGAVMLIDVVTAIVGIALLLRLPLSCHAPSAGRALPDLRAGLRYARMERDVGAALLLYGGFTFLCVPAGYLSGLLVSRVYGDSYAHLTLTELSGFLGMTAGGLLMSVRGGVPQKAAARGLALFGAMAVCMALTQRFAVYLCAMLLYGVALTVVQTALTTLLQQKTAPAMQGRVFGLFSSLYAGCYPLGMAVFGPLADVLPLPWLMAGSGGLLVIAALGVWRRRGG